MCRPTSRSCLKFLSEDLRTVEVSAVALTTPDSKRPRAHERYEQSFQVHGARALNKSTSKKPSLAILPTMKSTTMLTPRVLARIGDLWNFLANIVLCLPFRRTINRHPTCRLRSVLRHTRAPQPAILSSWSLIKYCGLATPCTVL